jgi:tetratricopeptide (TPR) repeat protein
MVGRVLTVCATLAAVALAPTAGAQTCDTYFSTSKEMSSVMTDAFAAITARDMKAATAALPKIDVLLNALPAAEIKPEVCDGNHINAYTTRQYIELSLLRAKGVDTGLPANLPLVKQPDLNHGSLAYAVGWIKYEQGNFTGALAAFEKGLAMLPHNPELQNEYLSTLLQLSRYDALLTYTDGVLNGPHLLGDDMLGKFYLARGIAQKGKGDLQGADSSFKVSLNYAWNEGTKALQDEVKTALARKP